MFYFYRNQVWLKIIITHPSHQSSFTPVPEDAALKFLGSSKTETCDLDLIPTLLVEECVDLLNTLITNIKNYSFKESSFPNCFNDAYATPPEKTKYG